MVDPRDMDFPAPWHDPCHAPDPMEPDAKKRLRMQQSFHMAVRYRGQTDDDKSGKGNEEREAIMDHYDILGPEMRWDFVKSYHAAEKKSEWRHFVLDRGMLPEDVLKKSEYREDLERLRARDECGAMEKEDQAVQIARQLHHQKIMEKVAADAEAHRKLLERLVVARRTPSEVLEAEHQRMAHEDELWHRRRALDDLWARDRQWKNDGVQNWSEALWQWRRETTKRLPALQQVKRQAQAEAQASTAEFDQRLASFFTRSRNSKRARVAVKAEQKTEPKIEKEG